MIPATSIHPRIPASSQAVHLAKAATLRHAKSHIQYPVGLRLACAASQQHHTPRYFSTTRATQLREIFPARDTPHIETTPPAWPHHGYTMEEMTAVVPGHRKPESFRDWVAWKTVRLARYWMDKATGMESAQKVDKKNPTTAVVAEKPLTEAQWVGHHMTQVTPGDPWLTNLSDSLSGSSSSKASPAFQAWSVACCAILTASDD